MGAPVSSKDEQMKKNVRATLANQLQQLSFDFRRKQRGFFFVFENFFFFDWKLAVVVLRGCGLDIFFWLFGYSLH